MKDIPSFSAFVPIDDFFIIGGVSFEDQNKKLDRGVDVVGEEVGRAGDPAGGPPGDAADGFAVRHGPDDP
mgnify:CR=1 FL=1